MVTPIWNQGRHTDPVIEILPLACPPRPLTQSLIPMGAPAPLGGSGSRSRYSNPYLRPYLPLLTSSSIKQTVVMPALLQRLQVKQI